MNHLSTDQECSIYIENCGLGPARITDLRAKYQNKRIEAPQEEIAFALTNLMSDAIAEAAVRHRDKSGAVKVNAHTGSAGKHFYLQAGERWRLLGFDDGIAQHEKIKSAVFSVEIEIEYESLYREKFRYPPV